MKRASYHSKDFSLLELLVIIGLLASYVGPRYFAQVGKSETKVARAQYRLDVERFPLTEPRLQCTRGARLG